MKYLFVIVLLFIASTLSAQNLSYTYDAAGNRTERTITLGSQQLKSSTETSSVDPVEYLITEHGIKIYPNPTKGMLSVEISRATAPKLV